MCTPLEFNAHTFLKRLTWLLFDAFCQLLKNYKASTTNNGKKSFYCFCIIIAF